MTKKIPVLVRDCQEHRVVLGLGQVGLRNFPPGALLAVDQAVVAEPMGLAPRADELSRKERKICHCCSVPERCTAQWNGLASAAAANLF